MTESALEARGWSRNYWSGLVMLVFGAQLGLIFWLGDFKPMPAKPATPAPQLRIVGPGSAEWLALTDPTFFARPHRQGFSGPAWMSGPTQEIRPFFWSEKPDWLPLPAPDLGAAFGHIVARDAFASHEAFAQPEPELTQPFLEPMRPFPKKSTLQLAGDLLRRTLLIEPQLPSWTNAEVLTNTVIEVTVDADGLPVSTRLRIPGSGSREAELNALEFARSARFEPLPAGTSTNTLTSLSWGEMIFVWHTVPAATTNQNAPALRR